MKVKEYLNIEDVCKMFEISESTLYRIMEKEPELPRLKVGGSVRFIKEDLERYFKSRGER